MWDSKGHAFNPKKCKVMAINFLQYQPGPPAPITIKGCPVHQVQTYKLLGVHVSHDLSWNAHVEHIVTKACKRVYALRLLRKSGVACADLVSIYCALVRSVLEYAAPVWAALPLYLDNLVESVQRKTLRIMFPAVDYNSALYQSGLKTLNERHKEICTNFTSYVRGNGREPIFSLLPATVKQPHGYGLRSGSTPQSRPRANTDRLRNFIYLSHSPNFNFVAFFELGVAFCQQNFGIRLCSTKWSISRFLASSFLTNDVFERILFFKGVPFLGSGTVPS